MLKAHNNPHSRLSKTGGGRNSNLEILRIVSMCLVMMLHYLPTRLMPSATSIRTNFWESLLNLELRSIAFVAVNCFVLISGYFGINWKIKSFSSLIFRILFWSLISYIFAKGVTPAVLKETYTYSGHVISNIFTLRWFIGAYLCLYIFSPVLNAFLNNTDQRQSGLFLIAFYTLSSVFGWVLKSHEFYEGMSMLALSGLYLIGGYIKRFSLKILNFNHWVDLSIYISIGFILVILSAAAYYFNAEKSLYGYLNPLVIIQSIYLFLFFKKLKIDKSRFINIVAASSFSVYLFHTDICSRPLWYYGCNMINTLGPICSLFMIGIFFAAIFLFCVIVDFVGTLVFNAGEKLLLNGDKLLRRVTAGNLKS